MANIQFDLKKKKTFSWAVSDGVQFIYVLCGRNTVDNSLDSVERYDIQQNSWTLLNPLPIRDFSPACLYIDGIIIVSGGKDGTANKDIYLYFITSNNWVISSTHLTAGIPGHALCLVLLRTLLKYIGYIKLLFSCQIKLSTNC